MAYRNLTTESRRYSTFPQPPPPFFIIDYDREFDAD